MLTEKEKQLIDEIVPYVIYKVNKNHFHFPIKKEDVISEILEKVTTKFKNYNPDLNDLIPYLDKCISGWIKNYYSRTQEVKPEGKQEHEVIWEEYNHHNEYEKDIAETFWEERRDQIIREEIDNLDDRLRQILKYYYYENKTFEQIGSRFNLTRERIRQLTKKAELILKPKIAERLAELERVREQL